MLTVTLRYIQDRKNPEGYSHVEMWPESTTVKELVKNILNNFELAGISIHPSNFVLFKYWSDTVRLMMGDDQLLKDFVVMRKRGESRNVELCFDYLGAGAYVGGIHGCIAP